jgi:hypothetical protein
LRELVDYPVLLFVLLTLSFAVAYEAGTIEARLFRRVHEEVRGQISSIQTGLLALVGLMIGFTFAMALSRFDQRRQLVIDEANAIHTTRLRAALLPEPYHGDIDRLLHEYVAARLEFFNAGYDRQRIEKALGRADSVQHDLWSNTLAAARERPDPITATFVQALNQTIDLSEKRIDALEDRIPVTVWWTLLTVSAVACFLTGNMHQRRRTVAVLALPLVLAAVLGLIANLDAPRTGTIRISQRSMMRLKAEHLTVDPRVVNPDE